MNDSKDLKEKDVVLDEKAVDTNDSTEVKTPQTENSNDVETPTENAETSEQSKPSDKEVETPTEKEEHEEGKVVPFELPKKEEEVKDEIELNFMDKDLVLECMSIPTYSRSEFRLIAFIILWARRNKLKYEFDDYGNIYITKGELAEGEYYPCVTSHLDTVHKKHEPYIYAGVPLDLKIELTKENEHKVSVHNTGGVSIGIGADDKSGIAICLSMFDHFDKLKACFFLEEEIGCLGSKELWEDWFKDVGYVIGYDSPELYRAAYACSGVNLFSYKFYETYMKDVCDAWGLTKGHFHSEPFTDVKTIREKIGVICMNFGNGGYNAHGDTEYCILEHMDAACGMGVDLIEKIGRTRHYLKHRDKWDKSKSFIRSKSGIYTSTVDDDDDKLATLSDRRSYVYGGTSSYNTNKTTTTVSFDEQLKFESVKYIVNRYETRIKSVKEDVLESVKSICEASNIDFSLFEDTIKEKFSTEITF